MIEVALSIIDNLRTLLKERGARDKEQFEKLVSPMVRHAEEIVKDYNIFFKEMRKMIESDVSDEELKAWAENRRHDARPVRDKLRKLSLHRGLSNQFGEFEKAIWTLLTGHDQSSPITDNSLEESRMHTIRDLVCHAASTARGESHYTYRKRVMSTISEKREIVAGAWSRICDYDAKMRVDLLPKHRPKRRG